MVKPDQRHNVFQHLTEMHLSDFVLTKPVLFFHFINKKSMSITDCYTSPSITRTSLLTVFQ